jgi:hypothetical protein
MVGRWWDTCEDERLRNWLDDACARGLKRLDLRYDGGAAFSLSAYTPCPFRAGAFVRRREISLDAAGAVWLISAWPSWLCHPRPRHLRDGWLEGGPG